MGAVSGSFRKLTLDGVPYEAAGDVNVTFNASPYETEGIPSTGRIMYKMTLRPQNVEGLPILATPSEQDQIRALAERIGTFPMAMTWADGSVWRCVGKINFESVESEENRASIIIIPDRSPGGWTLFAA